LLFVYDKNDDSITETARLNLVNCIFVRHDRTGDYMMTKMLRQMLENGANKDDIIGYLIDRNIPADDITLNILAEKILKNPPKQGYLTISNALQWRLQYGRLVNLDEEVEGLVQVINIRE